MIKGVMFETEKVDNRHTVAIKNSISFASAIQVNENGTYESVTYMIDDVRTWNNTAIIDATEEEKEIYRKSLNRFKIGDKVKIIKGKKMLGETKEIANMFKFIVPNTYGKVYTNYLVFTDKTKVNELNCKII